MEILIMYPHHLLVKHAKLFGAFGAQHWLQCSEAHTVYSIAKYKYILATKQTIKKAFYPS
jgi:hypothetical protein